MQTLSFLLFALVLLAYGLVSRRLASTVVTAPIFCVVCGWLLGPSGLGLLHLSLDGHGIHLLAELTLVLVLFTDASRIRLGRLRRDHDLPTCMLLLGMPLTIAAGTGAGLWLLGGLTFWACAVLAIVLAPTDAALGQAVVSSPTLPVRIRQALNVESGLNDGIALPVLLIVLYSACATEGRDGFLYWAHFAALQVTVGPAVGAAVGYLGGRLIAGAVERRWMEDAFQSLAAIGIALLAFAGAEPLGGNGFIAAFTAGLVMGNTARHSLLSHLWEFGEAQGQLLSMIVFLVFGALMAPHAVAGATPVVWLYAVLSLTVVRMLPVALSLLGKKLQWETVFFLGWFGPRGLASILFALLVVETSVLPGREEVEQIVLVVVLLSVLAHGLTAVPLSRWYARRIGEGDDTEDRMEHQPVSEMPLRAGD